jgi:hypothetical protein
LRQPPKRGVWVVGCGMLAKFSFNHRSALHINSLCCVCCWINKGPSLCFCALLSAPRWLQRSFLWKTVVQHPRVPFNVTVSLRLLAQRFWVLARVNMICLCPRLLLRRWHRVLRLRLSGSAHGGCLSRVEQCACTHKISWPLKNQLVKV